MKCSKLSLAILALVLSPLASGCGNTANVEPTDTEVDTSAVKDENEAVYHDDDREATVDDATDATAGDRANRSEFETSKSDPPAPMDSTAVDTVRGTSTDDTPSSEVDLAGDEPAVEEEPATTLPQ